MGNITGSITPAGQLSASVRRVQSKEVKAVAQGTTATSLTELADVDATLLADGAMLIYDNVNNKFKITPVIENENTQIVGGKY